jgi:hypothetical protein
MNSGEFRFSEMLGDYLEKKTTQKLRSRLAGNRRERRRLRAQNWCLRVMVSMALSGDQAHEDAARQLAGQLGVTTGRLAAYRGRTGPQRLSEVVAEVWGEHGKPEEPLRGYDGRYVAMQDLISPKDRAMRDDAHCLVTVGMPNSG